ncbi:MAG: hypothetical protein H6Q72_4419 [Firmicutes bacterium]|nr:hypothetical protein [Bacillota bacterium]
MSISSIGNSIWTFANPYYNQTSTTNPDAATGGSSSKYSSSSETEVISTNADGDTFQLSSAAQTALQSYSLTFNQIDTNGNTSLSEEEFVAARPSDVNETTAVFLYSLLDTDNSNSLTKTEYVAKNSAFSVKNSD